MCVHTFKSYLFAFHTWRKFKYVMPLQVFSTVSLDIQYIINQYSVITYWGLESDTSGGGDGGIGFSPIFI